MTLLSVDEARDRILAAIQPVTTTRVALDRAAGRVLSRPIHAPSDLPPFDNSSMDGFALRAADSASSLTLRVVADIPAGSHPTRALQPGEAARIMTGAPLPSGADAVIPVEDTDFTARDAGTPAPESVKLTRAVRPGENVRPRGQDIRAGETVLQAGQRLRAQDLGLLAMMGVAEAPVYRVPRVALLSSGDELIPVHEPLAPGKIHDSNSYALAAQIESCGAEVLRLGVAKDERAAVQSLLDRAVDADAGADMIVSSAGVSVGAFDFVKEVVESNGRLDFWKVNMRPGKPLAFGEYRGVPFIGLPGNPVSAFVTFEVFARAALQKLAGVSFGARPRTRVVTEEAIESDGRESYLRAVVDASTNRARLTGHQGSGNLFSLVQANALLIIPAGVKSRPANAEVDAWLL
ncbi:MAG: gephyrin-like molybdotransferase Glp [Chloroflexota bacterium]